MGMVKRKSIVLPLNFQLSYMTSVLENELDYPTLFPVRSYFGFETCVYVFVLSCRYCDISKFVSSRLETKLVNSFGVSIGINQLPYQIHGNPSIYQQYPMLLERTTSLTTQDRTESISLQSSFYDYTIMVAEDCCRKTVMMIFVIKLFKTLHQKRGRK